MRWSLKGGGDRGLSDRPPQGGLSDARGGRTDGESRKTDRSLGKMGREILVRIFSFHEIERFLITYPDEMQVIGNPSTAVPRHAAVVEAGLTNREIK